MSTKDIFQWIEDFAERAVAARDRDRFELYQTAVSGLQTLSDDPDAALGVLETARGMALRLGEPKWVLFCDHWRLQTLIGYKRDLSDNVLALARQSVLEALKPHYDDFPQRTCLREDLISYYLGSDPHGFHDDVATAISDMEAETDPESPCYHCLLEMRTEFLVETAQADSAKPAALNALKQAASASDYWHAVFAYAHLCQIDAWKEDWKSVRHWAEAGLSFEGRCVKDSLLAEMLMWRALALQHLGDSLTAGQCVRRARSVVRAMRAVPAPGYFEAACRVHEASGQLARALVTRRRQVRLITGKGQPALETRCRLEVVRLLAALDRPYEDELYEAEIVAETLRLPSDALAEVRKWKTSAT